MIDPAQPTEDEKDILTQHYHCSPSRLTRERAHAILLSSQGYTPRQISEILFRSEKTAREWIKAFNKQRISSIFSKHWFNQNAAKLTREQKEQIANTLSKPLSEYSLPKEFWEVKSLKRHIKSEFDVEYQSNESYYLIFRLAGFSFHVPNTFSTRRDDNLIERRMKEIRRELKKYQNDPNWVILVADESRILWRAIIRKAWFPKGSEGKKTILKIEHNTEHQNYFGALNLKTGKPHLIKLPWQNKEEIITALKYLKRNYRGKRICLIWDNASFHRSNLLKAKLKKGGELSMYHLINLPPYAPDKNPQEKIWGYAKGQIANHQTSSFQQTKSIFRRTVMGRRYNFQI